MGHYEIERNRRPSRLIGCAAEISEACGRADWGSIGALVRRRRGAD
jgi:hypothetical protein